MFISFFFVSLHSIITAINMKTVNGQQVREALSKQIRVYLCGDLAEPEDFESVKTDGLEIGISHYKEYTAEKAHLHKWNHEYNFIRRGCVKVYVFSEHKEYEFHQDDMYVIEPGMEYVTKAKAGTEVLFVKSPGGNDKELLPVTEAIQSWGEDWNAEMKEQ